jgi:D-alanyl-D-alanine carboxypeptidase
VGRPDGGWPQDRAFQRRRLLPDRHRQARPAAADLGGARHRLRGSPRPGFAQPAQLGLTGFDAVKLYDKGQAISQLKVFKGVQNLVGAGFAEDFVVSVPRGMADKVTAPNWSAGSRCSRLIAAGSQVGTLKLAVGGQPWGEYPVVAQSEVPLAGFLGRLWDDIRLFFQ